MTYIRFGRVLQPLPSSPPISVVVYPPAVCVRARTVRFRISITYLSTPSPLFRHSSQANNRSSFSEVIRIQNDNDDDDDDAARVVSAKIFLVHVRRERAHPHTLTHLVMDLSASDTGLPSSRRSWRSVEPAATCVNYVYCIRIRVCVGARARSVEF